MRDLVLPTYRFAEEVTAEGVSYRKDPFELKAGGYSNWYIDHRAGLSRGDVLYTAGVLVAEKANKMGAEYDVVVGEGIGGYAIAISTMRAAGKKWCLINKDKNDKSLKDGYGPHGADIEGKRVLRVDDITSTGQSILEATEVILEFGGILDENVVTVTDRSAGTAAELLGRHGINHGWVLDFDESTANLFPA